MDQDRTGYKTRAQDARFLCPQLLHLPRWVSLSAVARGKAMLRRERQERHVARSFDRPRDHALMLGASRCLAAGADLASFGDKLFQLIDLLVGYAPALVPRAPRAAGVGPSATATPIAIRARAAARAASSARRATSISIGRRSACTFLGLIGVTFFCQVYSSSILYWRQTGLLAV